MNLTERVKSLLLQPAQEWAVIEKEPSATSDLYASYIVLPTATRVCRKTRLRFP
jgi:hypothetical protein